ncbi:hypothetical protein IFM51744_04454 [Aspergillus udagawae]|nr:hypothetical protein IFM51744_04454 [Aspergillus udagawae]GFG19101.1 hypothetical protein IFM5058_09706 [Aspergillus udagawae]
MTSSEKTTTSPPSPHPQALRAPSCPPKISNSCTSSHLVIWSPPLDVNQWEQLHEAIPDAAAGSSEQKAQEFGPPNTPEGSSSKRTGPTVPLPYGPGAYANQAAEIMPVPVPAGSYIIAAETPGATF